MVRKDTEQVKYPGQEPLVEARKEGDMKRSVTMFISLMLLLAFLSTGVPGGNRKSNGVDYRLKQGYRL